MFLQDVLSSLGPDEYKSKEDILRERNEYIRQTIDALTQLNIQRIKTVEEFTKRVNSEAELNLWIKSLEDRGV